MPRRLLRQQQPAVPAVLPQLPYLRRRVVLLGLRSGLEPERERPVRLLGQILRRRLGGVSALSTELPDLL